MMTPFLKTIYEETHNEISDLSIERKDQTSEWYQKEEKRNIVCKKIKTKTFFNAA